MNKSVLILLVVAISCATFSVAKPEKQVASLKSLGVDKEPRSCEVLTCDINCKMQFWQGGSCINGNCFCWKYTYGTAENKQQEKQVVSLKSLGGEHVAQACYPLLCDASCKKFGYMGGNCKNGVCNCWKY